MAAAIPFIIMGASTILSMRANNMQAAQAKAEAGFEAAQLNQNADATEASAQRSAGEQQRQARIVNSRVQALAANSGAGATDPTVLDIQGNIAKEGEYNALSALYSGQTQADSMRNQASSDIASGKAAGQIAQAKNFATIVSSGSSLYDKYSGMKRAPSTDLSSSSAGVDGSVKSTRRYSNYA